ncbi:MAG: murein biosynthesis integral membrane protein MurJ, partial [Bacteroidetes bacterium]|nr:murein biosynthesis integral membrane protein MurJ [Bacteroidota bacterium]
GLAIGASCGAWVELVALRIALRRSVDGFRLPARRVVQMLGLAVLAVIPALGLRWILMDGGLPVFLQAVLVLGVYGGGYLLLGHFLRFEEGEAWIGRFIRRAK